MKRSSSVDRVSSKQLFSKWMLFPSEEVKVMIAAASVWRRGGGGEQLTQSIYCVRDVICASVRRGGGGGGGVETSMKQPRDENQLLFTLFSI